MSAKPRVRAEHLIKLHRELEIKKHFGSVMIHYQDGKITGVTVKDDYDPASFIDRCDNSINRVVVRIKKAIDTAEETEKCPTGNKLDEIGKKIEQPGASGEDKSIVDKEKGKKAVKEAVAINRIEDGENEANMQGMQPQKIRSNRY